jgi:putative transposase
VLVEGKSRQIEVRVILTDYQRERLEGELDTPCITRKSGKYIAQIAVELPEEESIGDKVMDVDQGLKIPAVAVIEGGKTGFLGNGGQNKFVKGSMVRSEGNPVSSKRQKPPESATTKNSVG